MLEIILTVAGYRVLLAALNRAPAGSVAAQAARILGGGGPGAVPK